MIIISSNSRDFIETITGEGNLTLTSWVLLWWYSFMIPCGGGCISIGVLRESKPRTTRAIKWATHNNTHCVLPWPFLCGSLLQKLWMKFALFGQCATLAQICTIDTFWAIACCWTSIGALILKPLSMPGVIDGNFSSAADFLGHLFTVQSAWIWRDKMLLINCCVLTFRG